MSLFPIRSHTDQLTAETVTEESWNLPAEEASSHRVRIPPPPPPPVPKPITAEPEKIAAGRDYQLTDVLDLLRELPRGNTDEALSIVQKTLLSVNIDLQQLLEEAGTSVSRIRHRQKQIRKEIKNLEMEISSRRQTLAGMDEESKTLTGFRNRFRKILR